MDTSLDYGWSYFTHNSWILEWRSRVLLEILINIVNRAVIDHYFTFCFHFVHEFS